LRGDGISPSRAAADRILMILAAHAKQPHVEHSNAEQKEQAR
jgi:hypothetical protein